VVEDITNMKMINRESQLVKKRKLGESKKARDMLKIIYLMYSKQTIDLTSTILLLIEIHIVTTIIPTNALSKIDAEKMNVDARRKKQLY
jgi:hypothetical protein